MKRLAWIDFAKSFTIFCVVVLHTHANAEVTKWLNAFVMPVFFSLSGFLFSYERNPRYIPFLRKRARQLLVPYLWINALAYLLWLFVLRHFGNDAGSGTAWHEPLIGALAGIPAMLSHDTPMWSILSFFVVEAMFFPVGRRAVCRRGFMLCGLLVAWVVSAFFSDFSPFIPLTLGPSCAAVAFYGLGYELQRAGDRANLLFRLPLILVFAAVFCAAVSANGEVEFYICRFGGNFALFVVASVAACLAVFGLAMRLARNRSSRFISFMAWSTLLICGFHLMAFAAVKGVALFGFGIEPGCLTANIWRGLALAAVATALSLCGAWLVKRYARFLVDK